MYTSKEMQVVAVTNRSLCHRPFPEQLEMVCQTHPAFIILREKDLPAQEYEKLAAQVLELCHSYEVPCVLHTYPDVARALGCTSIHLPLPLLREYAHELNDFTQIGSSVHSVEDAMEAERLGATYVNAGHVYVTDCKKGLAPRGLDFLRNVCKSVSIPVYAIGGIQLDADTHTIAQNQAAEIASCGAKGGCIMSGMMQFTP